MTKDDEDADCDEQWEAGYAECYIEWNKAQRHPRFRNCRNIDECAALYVSELCKDFQWALLQGEVQ